MKRMQAGDLSRLGISYSNFQRVTGLDGRKGTRYTLDNPMTAEQSQAACKYKNVIISTAQHRYAPEIRRQTIILFDDCPV